MPIKRLQRQAQFPCIGKLRKGGEKQTNASGKEVMGKDLTYFRFDSDDERAAKMFVSVYGNQPDTITVYLPYATTAENFQAWQEDWLAGGLQHRCDGETCVMWLDNGTYRTDPKPCPGGCKPVGRLMVIIPELQRFAYINCETHSQWDIMTLEENLLAVESLRGDLRGIPFILKRRPKEISTPGPNGKRVRREKWLLSIEVDPAWAAVQLEQMHRAALTAGVNESRMLPVADDYEDADYTDVDVDVDFSMTDIPDDSAAHMATPEPTNGAAMSEVSVPDARSDITWGALKAWSLSVGAFKHEKHATNRFFELVREVFDVPKGSEANFLQAADDNKLVTLREAFIDDACKRAGVMRATTEA